LPFVSQWPEEERREKGEQPHGGTGEIEKAKIGDEYFNPCRFE
jgi:hypothetical protein